MHSIINISSKLINAGTQINEKKTSKATKERNQVIKSNKEV